MATGLITDTYELECAAQSYTDGVLTGIKTRFIMPMEVERLFEVVVKQAYMSGALRKERKQ